MNLIEQLGGYEQAKEIAFDPLHPQMTHVSNCGRHWINEEFAHIPEINEQMKGMVKISEIRHALLEYRRANNFFELNDWVLTNNQDFSEEPCQLVEDCSFDFKYKTKSGHWGFIVKSFLPTKWRHATDDEIDAGKRLDSLSVTPTNGQTAI